MGKKKYPEPHLLVPGTYQVSVKSTPKYGPDILNVLISFLSPKHDSPLYICLHLSYVHNSHFLGSRYLYTQLSFLPHPSLLPPLDKMLFILQGQVQLLNKIFFDNAYCL